MKKVIKRDGNKVEYKKEKIFNAVFSAAKSVNDKLNQEGKMISEVTLDTKENKVFNMSIITPKIIAKKATDIINNILNEKYFNNNMSPNVEDIQDIVEDTLIELDYIDIAKAYIIYRENHSKLRDTKKLFNDVLKVVDKYLNLEDWKVNENSNMGFSLQGLNNHIASVVTSRYWLQKIYPEELKKLHDNGDFHIHDLSNLSIYCCGWDLRDLLVTGFSGVSYKTESKPPQHFSTALGQIVNFFYTLQGEASGAQAFSNFDTYLAPFIQHDDLSYKEVKQEMQEFIFNMNVPTRVGFQTPFSNLTMDLVPSPNIKDEPVIIGGKPHEHATYGEFQKEMDMLNKAFAELMLEGDSKGRVFSFPIPTYNITEEFDWDNSVYDPIWEMTAKYGIPYFSNFINSDMDPDQVRSMCCRLRILQTDLKKRGGGLFGANPMTGSVGVVTLNMARIGFLASDKKDFLQRTNYLLEKAKDSLQIKRKVIERLTEAGLYPYSKFYLRNIKKRFNEYWKNHFNTIGLNGMNEALINFMGKDISTKEGIDFTIEVMEYMRNKMIEFQKETEEMYNLEATPAESTSYRFAKIDKEKYGNTMIYANNERVKNEDADPYYTNSTQLPVGHTDDIFDVLMLQDDIQSLYTGGTVIHGFLGEKMPNITSTKKLVRKIAENFKIPYYTITPTFSICPVHGYLPGAHEYCPKCDNEIKRNKD